MTDLVRDDGMLDRAVDEVVRYAVDGIGPMKGAAELVEALRRKGMSTEQVVSRLVRTQTTQATVQGAVAGVGGFVSAAVGLVPATVASMFVQARLSAAIAHAHGHDVDDPLVRRRVAGLLTGSTVATGSRKVGLEMGEQAFRRVAPRVQARAAARVASRAASGRTGGVIATRVAGASASRAVPVVGAVVGGAVDLAMTRRVASRARQEFGRPPGSPPPRVVVGS